MSKKLKVLILTWEYFPVIVGGLAMLAKSVAEEMKSQGVKVDVAIPFIPKELLDDCGDLINLDKDIKKYLKKDLTIDGLDFEMDNFHTSKKKNVEIPPLFVRNKTNSYASKIYPKNTPKKTKAFAFAVRDLVKKGNYDVVIGMDWETIPAQVLLEELDIPFFYYVNATEADRSPSTYMKNGSSVIYNLEKKYFPRGKKVITVSGVTSQALHDIYEIDKDKTFAVYNDITFNPNLMGFAPINKGKNVIYIGRISAQKGLGFLVDTAQKVVNIDSQIKFFICGDGDSMSSVVDKISEYGLEKNVFITGWADQELKKQLYRSGDIFVMPSPREPFGLTALEAIRSGLPVISSTHCGFTAVVPSTPMFAYHDIDSFSQLILHYTNNNIDRVGLLKKQQNELAKHSWQEQVAGLIDLLKNNK